MPAPAYGYLRVSTIKQGTKGVSLQEQKRAIKQYAIQNDITIKQWFVEKETAAKRGRPIFNEVIGKLKKGSVQTLVIHKICRGARNLKDWANIGELVDSGIDVHIAHENLDLHERGGRLAADIQAVVAADFIRNLRQEAKKGMTGRLRQGLYPMRAPLGYLNKGGGKVKEIDPEKGPFILDIFTLYANGEYSLQALADKMHRQGLRNLNGGKVSRNGISTILNNPFYYGLIRIKKSGEYFEGKHEPIITQKLFNEAQDVLAGKKPKKTRKHPFLFRKILTCTDCGYTMTGEKQKDYVYYRCHQQSCKRNCINEIKLTDQVEDKLNFFQLTDQDAKELEDIIEFYSRDDDKNIEQLRANLLLEQSKQKKRLSRLSDKYIDDEIDKDLYLTKKNEITKKMHEIKSQLTALDDDSGSILQQRKEIFERVKNLYTSYLTLIGDEKRQLVKTVTSNFSTSGKKPLFELKSPYEELLKPLNGLYCEPCRTRFRTINNAAAKFSTPCQCDSQINRKSLLEQIYLMVTNYCNKDGHTSKSPKSPMSCKPDLSTGLDTGFTLPK